MKARHLSTIKKVGILFVILISLTGCGRRKTHLVSDATMKEIQSFKYVEVREITVGSTTDELSDDTTINLRAAIIAALQQKGNYQKVAAKIDQDEDVLVIESKIVEFCNGSIITDPHLDVSCTFIKKKTNQILATRGSKIELSGNLREIGSTGLLGSDKILLKNLIKRTTFWITYSIKHGW